MLKNLRHYYSPYFLCRHYIRKSIQDMLGAYNFRGSLLDIGCGQKPYRNLFAHVSEYKGIDFKDFSVNRDFEQSGPDFFFDENYKTTSTLSFDSASFDNTIAFQVLEHHPVPEKLVDEMIRVTRSGGYILLTAPFLGGIHEEPHDYQRYTIYGLKKLFENKQAQILQIKSSGSVMSTIVCLFNEYVNILAGRGGLSYLIALALYPLDMLLQYASLAVDKFITSEHILFNYTVLAQKI